MDVRLAGQFAVALGIGLLIGAERERRKAAQGRSTAGIRTFGLASLGGALAVWLGGALLLAAAVAGMTALAVVGYLSLPTEDRGLTTETALLVAVLLGALAMRQTDLAAGVGVIVTIVLAEREELHRFVRTVLSKRELDDALLFAAATLIVLPLLPATPIDPLGVLVPRTVWELAVLVMGVSAAGYIALRAVGPRLGLPLAGLASGFISGIATIGAMGVRAKSDRGLERPAVAGAALSNVSTVVQLAAILLIVSPPMARAAAGPLLLAGLAAAAYGAVFTIRDLRHETGAHVAPGRAFDLRIAISLAALVTAVLFAAAVLDARLGPRALAAAMTLAGFADTHAPAFSVASLVAGGRLSAQAAVVPIVAALTTNTVTKGVVAFASGGRRFAVLLVPGLALIAVAAWVGIFVRI